MKKISFKSPFGILLFVILPLVIILAISGIRLDLTKEKRYTLSDSTIKVLESVKKPMMINVYLEGDFPADFKQLQSETRFMLENFRKVNPNVDFKFIDPIKSAIPKDTLLARGIFPSVLDDRKNGKTSQIEIYPYALIRNGKLKLRYH
jgi:ABC-2 type transport system permease protein